ncbi:hypothetical protein WJW37_07855, partial [Lactiplantibacillus plantarum]
MKKLRQILQKILIGLMVFVLVFTVFSGSVDTVSAHRRGVTHTRKHKVRHRASGHAKKSHRAHRKAKRRVVHRKAPHRRKVAVRHKKKAAPKRHKKSHKKRAAKKHKKSHKKKA